MSGFPLFKDCPHRPIAGVIVTHTVRCNALCIATTEQEKWLQGETWQQDNTLTVFGASRVDQHGDEMNVYIYNIG